MTRTLTTTAAALAALAWPPPSTGAAAAQETTALEALEKEALEKLQRAERPDYTSTVRILRQVSVDWRGRATPAPRTPAELDAFADRVAAVAADATLPDRVRAEASYALMSAANPESGYGATTYARAFDLLVEAYEGGYGHALSVLMTADSVRGMAYVRELFDRSERPPLCRWIVRRSGMRDPATNLPMPPVGRYEPPECVRGFHTFHDAPFCEAGSYLFRGIVDEAWERTPGGRPDHDYYGPMPIPEGLPEHVEDWHRRCL